MKFNELREANLSKAQINKVHDKADDLPKSDFIKRYGKEGDAVRFATATNIIKKQLNIEALDKEDEKSIGDVIKGLKKAVKSHQGQVKSLTKDIQDGVEEGGPGSGPQVDVKQKKKDKADTQRLLDRQKRQGLQKIGRRNEEVVTEAVSAALVNQISRMTDRNNHFGVRIELARIAGDKELMRYYDSLEKMHNKLGGVIGNSALEVRQKLESVLKNRLQRKFNDKDADRLMGAL